MVRQNQSKGLLTRRQYEIFAYIQKYIRYYGVNPSNQDIADHFVLSRRTVEWHITNIKRKGWLKQLSKTRYELS